jgi:hypothetical protein
LLHRVPCRRRRSASAALSPRVPRGSSRCPPAPCAPPRPGRAAPVRF